MREAFLAYLRDERRASPYTLRNYTHAVEAYELYYRQAYGNQIDWAKVTTLQARDYIIELQRTLERRSVHNRIAALRSMYRWGIKQGSLKVNPFKGVSHILVV